MKLRKCFVAVVVSGFLFLQGCGGDFWGGGWMWSGYDSEQWANLGFEGSCEDSSSGAVLTLNFTLHDRGYPADDVYNQNNNGKKHMAIQSEDGFSIVKEGITCEQWASYGSEDNVSSMEGRYCPPGGVEDDCGMIEIEVSDSGNVGPSKGDSIAIVLVDGHYHGYELQGELEKGNVTVAF